MFLKKIKKYFRKVKKDKGKYVLVSLLLVLLTCISIVITQIYSNEKVNPGIKIANIYVGNLKTDEAVNILRLKVEPPEEVILTSGDKKYEIYLETIDFSYDFEKTAQKALKLTRTGNFFFDLGKKVSLLFKNENLGLEIILNENKLKELLQEFAKELETKPITPSVELSKGVINVEKGQKGNVLDYLLLRATIGESLSHQNSESIKIPFQKSGDILSDLEIEAVRKRAQNVIDKNLIFTFKDYKYVFDDEKIVSFLDPKNEYKKDQILQEIQKISSEIYRDPQNSSFVFEEGFVKEFTPALDGYIVEEDKLETIIVGNLRTLEQEDKNTIYLDIPVRITKPKIQNKDVNDLGIETLIGKGTSKFVGSITNRIYNIGHASEKFRGILVAPGETFSFNKTLGDVSQETGFRQAYIIKEGKTILGDGGGVCQVSTTLFRAALKAGLPILERQAHAYRVGYYEQDSPPGIDATVYEPHPDLVFKNDTPKHILIQAVFNAQNKTLAFEIYGTDDGRIATTTKPVISSVTPPPDDLYQDDPTLPQGTIKQIEYKAWGAKVKFDYTVKKDGEIIIKKTFFSNYQPWQAVYLRGTMPQ